jgi:hypothetical protein
MERVSGRSLTNEGGVSGRSLTNEGGLIRQRSVADKKSQTGKKESFETTSRVNPELRINKLP